MAQYASRLQAPWRTPLCAYCNAYISFSEGQYAQAKKQLLEIEYFDAAYKISQQLLLLRIYFEENDWQGLESTRAALKIYLYRNKKLPVSTRSAANNFARFAVRIFHLKGLQASEKSALKIIEKMKSCTHLRDRIWLMAKAEALITQ